MSDDEPPPLPPNHFDIVITSYWSLISPPANYSVNLGWPFFKARSASEAPQFSTLCQLIELQVPSDLSQDTFHISTAEVNQSGTLNEITINREGSCKVTPFVLLLDEESESSKPYLVLYMNSHLNLVYRRLSWPSLSLTLTTI